MKAKISLNFFFFSTQKYKTKTKNRHLYFLLTWKSASILTTLNCWHLSDSQIINWKMPPVGPKVRLYMSEVFSWLFIIKLAQRCDYLPVSKPLLKGKSNLRLCFTASAKVTAYGFVGETVVNTWKFRKKQTGNSAAYRRLLVESCRQQIISSGALP